MSKAAFRTLFTSVLFLAAIGVVIAFFVSSNPNNQLGGASKQARETITDPDASSIPTDEQSLIDDEDTEPDSEVTSDESPQPVPPPTQDPPLAESIDGLRFRVHAAAPLTPLGALDPDNASGLRLEFSPYGAGVEQITLADYFDTRQQVAGEEYALVRGADKRRPNLALRRVVVNGQRVNAYSELEDLSGSVFVETAPGQFEAHIVNGDDEVILTVRRGYTLGPAHGQITIEQSVENNSDQPVSVALEQWGPGDLPYIMGGYGDFRRIRFGYTDPRDPRAVLASDGEFIKLRNDWIKDVVKTGSSTIWPNETSAEQNYQLAWVASTSRYFAFVIHPDRQSNSTAITLSDIDQVQLFLESRGAQERSIADIPKAQYNERYINLKLITQTERLAPGAQAHFDLGAYAGPMNRAMFAKVEPYSALNFKSLVVYQLGCAMCTFQPITHALLWFLRLIDGQIITIGGVGIGVHDWAIAIMILVVCVRAVLHPLTKRGQVSMMRMSKKMGKLQPELAKLKEKYKGNPKKMQQEQMALYREHNINPAGCLGILPMLLQTPIWIALYAMLYFAIELRQEPAFYGLFQLFGDWAFMADLSQPDRFIDIGRSLLGSIPFVGQYLGQIPMLGPATSINLLPLLMGVMFFLQQKYMTPQTATLSPEQEAQQKIMRRIFPFIMPIFLYNAPSGLTLYIITSSAIGILESRYIRAHVDSLDLENEPTKPKKTSVWQQAMVEAQKRQQEKAGASSKGKYDPRGKRPKRKR